MQANMTRWHSSAYRAAQQSLLHSTVQLAALKRGSSDGWSATSPQSCCPTGRQSAVQASARVGLVAETGAVVEEPAEGLQSVSFEPIAEGAFCMPGEVSVDNTSSPDCTKLIVEARDFPGLLRVIAWVLNGLEYVAQQGRIKTDDEGQARNEFWLVDRDGNKLSNKAAGFLAERMSDYVVFCTPSGDTLKARHFAAGPIQVDNEAHERFSVVTISTCTDVEGPLLRVASAMTGAGANIIEATIETGGGCGEHPHAKERIFKLWVTDRDGRKLDFQRASSLVYALGLVFGKEMTGPLTPPNTNMFLPQ